MSFSIADIVSAFFSALTKSKKELRGYDILPLQYNSSTQINLMRPVNGWTVINMGANPVTVNGTIVLAQNEFIEVGGNEGEEFTGFLRLNFAVNLAVGNNALVVQKFYVPEGAKYDKIGL